MKEISDQDLIDMGIQRTEPTEEQLKAVADGMIKQFEETFESELHDLITKYDLCHSTITPEHIKQQIMRDNVDDHNKSVRGNL